MLLGTTILLVPVVKGFGASGLDPSVIEEDFSAKAAGVGTPKEVIVVNVAKKIEIRSQGNLESHRRPNWLFWSWGERAVGGSCAPVSINRATEWLNCWRDFAIDDLYGAHGATVVVQQNFNENISTVFGLAGIYLRSPKNVSPFHVLRVVLAAANSEPTDDNQTACEKNESPVSCFGFFAKSRPFQVFTIASTGAALLIGGLFLLRCRGALRVIGSILMLIGTAVAVYGPLFLPLEVAP